MKSLEIKLAQLIRMAQQLRGENHQLRQEIAAAQSANRRLEEKIGGAAQRLEALLRLLPEGASELTGGHAAPPTPEHMA